MREDRSVGFMVRWGIFDDALLLHTLKKSLVNWYKAWDADLSNSEDSSIIHIKGNYEGWHQLFNFDVSAKVASGTWFYMTSNCHWIRSLKVHIWLSCQVSKVEKKKEC